VLKKIVFFMVFMVFIILALFVSGCATRRPNRIEQIDYVKPATVEAAKYGIDERIASLERQLGESRNLNEAARSEIRSIRESCEAIIMAGGRSGDLIQDTIEKAEALDRWVNWAYSRLHYLENLFMAEIQDKDMETP